MKILLSILLAALCLTSAWAQQPVFTRQDTLRGTITPERAWWDLSFYDLHVKVDPVAKTFAGQNTIHYKVLQPNQKIQIDLQSPMRITKVTQNDVELAFNRDGNAWFINLANPQEADTVNALTVHFEGQPQVSENPPWSGGVVWQKDANGNDWVATANQGDGASLWWPCKDHMYDEPDSMAIAITAPTGLTAVANGRLRNSTKNSDGTTTFQWLVSNPINNYGVNINIADYVNFSEKYDGEKGLLDCSYYVLRYNLQKAKGQFAQVPKMLRAFEHWFGPYPFYEDSYKLVEVPYFGMEHQSSVTYGNGFKNGYGLRDVSFTGWGFNFDFIIIHESGHEWFANNITYKDVADMWIHESFTAYSENLFLNYHYGKEASAEYVIGTRKNIQNDRPIIGIYGVNYAGSGGDMYYKGANMLHTLRQLVGDDEKWRMMLRGLNETFYHQTVTTAQIENFLSEKMGTDLSPFFDQYLRDVRIPAFEYKTSGKQLSYRWANCVEGFDMAVEVLIDGYPAVLKPSTEWQELVLTKPLTKLEVDADYYVESRKVQ